MNKYILDADGNPVEEPDILKWDRWMEEADRSVARDENHLYLVSTIFIGLPPLLYESMVFPVNSLDELAVRRYATRAEALKGHKELVAKWLDGQKHEENP